MLKIGGKKYYRRLLNIMPEVICNQEKCPIWNICYGHDRCSCLFADVIAGEKNAIIFAQYYFPTVDLSRIIEEAKKKMLCPIS